MPGNPILRLPPLCSLQQLAKDVYNLRITFVNVQFIGNRTGWILVDTGYRSSNFYLIRRVAEHLYGPGAKPRAIVLTHGHFDHTGSLKRMLKEWDVKVYAHPLELPYLTGSSSYPPADPTVGGGAMATLFSRLFPRGPLQLMQKVSSFANDHRLHEVPGWEVLHTAGHAPGHISLFRNTDGILVAGDAFVTTNQESFWNSMFFPEKVIHRPPAYFTPDWKAARASVEALAKLKPRIVVSGHGLPLRGQPMQTALNKFSKDFKQVVPAHGRYAENSARFDLQGVVYVPPPVADPLPLRIAVGAALMVGLVSVLTIRRHK